MQSIDTLLQALQPLAENIGAPLNALLKESPMDARRLFTFVRAPKRAFTFSTPAPPFQAFEKAVAMDPMTYGILSIINTVFGTIHNIADSTAEWVENLDFTPLMQSIDTDQFPRPFP